MKIQPVVFLFFLFLPAALTAQDREKDKLGDKEYIIVKDYKPILGESVKISETPEGDTASATPPPMQYSVRYKKAATDYETSAIKAVKIKEEQLDKLYRSYVRLGLGNYTTYKGDLYLNALRSKKGALGLALNHFSGNPGLKDAGPAGFSNNHGGVFGKYFFDNSTFSGELNYDRNVVHYYGYDTNDTIISKEDLKQRFSKYGFQLGYGSNYLSRGNIDYHGTFAFSSMGDLYDVAENDLLFSGKAGKMISDYYANVDISFNYFRKTIAKNEMLEVNNDLSRNIVTVVPTLNFNRDKVNLVLGFNFSMEKNLGSKAHLFPKIDISVPVVENVLYAFGGVNGNIRKNSYQTIADENPFVSPSVDPFNTINKLELKAGLNANFSSLFVFTALVKYSTFDRLMFFINDPVAFNKFDLLFVDGKVLNVHAELAYTKSERFSARLRVDQYSFTLDKSEKPWHRPSTEAAITASYHLRDKLLLNGSLFVSGKYDARIQKETGFISEKVDGYLDTNLGIEYRYSKILSFYLNLNNLGFSRYYRWYQYPSERFNILGGISYSF